MERLKKAILRISVIFLKTIFIYFALCYLIGPGIIGIIYLILRVFGLFSEITSTQEIQTQIFLYGWMFGMLLVGFYYYMLAKLKGEKPMTYLKLNKLSFKQIIFLIIFAFSAQSIDGNIFSILSKIFPASAETYSQVLYSYTDTNFILFFIMAVLIGPPLEELMFRSIISRRLKESFSPIWVIIAQALLFGIFHLNGVNGISAAVGGCLYLLIILWTGSLYSGIIIHASSNFFGLISTLFVKLSSQYTWLNINKIYNVTNVILCILYIPMLWLIFKKRKYNSLDPNNPYWDLQDY